MPTKTKETPAAKKRSTAKQSTKQAKGRSTAQKTTTRKKAAQKTSAKEAATQAMAKGQGEAGQAAQQTMLEISEEQAPVKATTDTATEKQVAAESNLTSAISSGMDAGEASRVLVSQAETEADRPFLASQLISDNIWSPNAAIPTLDEATYAAQKAQAEAQRRAIEIASLNLQNMNNLHQLEQQNIDIAISAKNNETRNAQLAAAGIDYHTQLEMNGEKSQHLAQAAAKHQAAARESGYTDQLIALKDQNFELEIEQAQNVFAEKAARYRAQLTGQ